MALEPSRYRNVETIATAIALTVLVWVVFAQTLRYGFINFDDDRYVYDNPIITGGITWAGLSWVWTHSHSRLWHPLTTISHMLDCQLFGLHAGGHHFVNVLLHNVGVVLLFLILRTLTGTFWRSAFVAAVFAVHPLRVESVAWISERKDVLSGVLAFLTVGAYWYYAKRPSAKRFGLVVSIYALGLLSKATLVPLPVVLLLLDYWPLRRTGDFRRFVSLTAEKIPLLFLAAVASLATLHAQKVTMPSLAQLSVLPRIKNAFVSIAIYVRQTFWPTDLAIFYPHPHDQLRAAVVIGCAALVLGASVAVIFLRRFYPYFFVGWFWFLILLLPVIGLTQAGLQGHADRFTYLPQIGLLIALSWGAADLTAQWRRRAFLFGPVAAAILCALTLLSWRQTIYWHDSISIWTHALAVTTDNETAHQNLAAALYQAGNRTEATRHQRSAAIIHWQTFSRDDPYDNHARDELGALLVQTGHVREAMTLWQESLRLDPNDGNALNNLAWVYATSTESALRDGTKAVQLARQAVSLPKGDSPIVLRTLAAAEAEGGNFTDAVTAGERAIALAQAQGNQSLVATLRREIELYQTATAYREAAPSD